MATFHTGSGELFDTLAFGEVSNHVRSYVAEQQRSLGNILSDAGKMFMAQARDLYDKFSDSSAVIKAKAITRELANIWNKDIINVLDTIESLRSANTAMIPYIMAEPMTRELFHRNKLDGYSDSYTDPEPDAIGENSYIYQNAIDGLTLEDDDGDIVRTRYYIDEDLGIEPLCIQDQMDIQQTWEHQRLLIKNKKGDFTSIWGGALD